MRKETRLKYRTRDTLVIGLNIDGEIIRFNKECQKITGYNREEVLKRKICDVLIPEHSFQKWEEIFDLATSEDIDNFKIPWKTRDRKEILISLSSFPIETKEGSVRGICFIGKNLGINVYNKYSFKKSEEKLDREITPQESEERMESTKSKNKDRMTVKKDNGQIIFAEEVSREADESIDDNEEVVFPEVKEPVISNFSESHKLDERGKELSELEVKLIQDRKNLDKRIAEFSKWKEKLITLESEIEKRGNELVEQKKTLRENSIFSPTKGVRLDGSSILKKEGSAYEESIDREDPHEILDKIPQCAAIVQRGILKRINSSFAELIGFETDEIVNKSFLDFIAPEGLVGIERYYLNRLQRSGKFTYKTVLSTKNNRKILVEIFIKPTFYDGEKAEITVVNEVKNLQKE
jgi:PAS domain S-box-containing protein